jgi:translin
VADPAGDDRPGFHAELVDAVDEITEALTAAHHARERALPECRRVIRAAGSSIRAVHRLDAPRAAALADEAETALRNAQAELAPFPAVAHAGFLHDAEKEYAEARFTIAMVAGGPLPSVGELAVAGPSWLRGLAEAASELRRFALDRLRDGDLAQAERLLGVMDDVYDSLMVIDFPDAITSGLRRTVDALRAVVERTRGDVTTTAVQMRLQHAIEHGDAHGR